MSIVINVVEESPGNPGNTVDRLEEEHGKVCSQIDALGDEIYMIDELMEQLEGHDSSITKDELRYHALLDNSLVNRLDVLEGYRKGLLHILSDIRNDLETRLRVCEDESTELEGAIEEAIRQEEEETENLLSRKETLWDSQEREQDNTWSSNLWSV